MLKTQKKEMMFIESIDSLEAGSEWSIVHSILKAQHAAQRRGTASTKTRAEVRGSTRKPYRQKGTGRARRGTERSPLKVGGGIIFGPKPRDFSMKMNKRVTRRALRYVLSYRQSDIQVIESGGQETVRQVQQFLTAQGVAKDSRVLFILNEDNVLARSCKSIKTSVVLSPRSLDISILLNVEKIYMDTSVVDALSRQLSPVSMV